MAITTNLLSSNDAGFEVDIGSWTAGSNTSVARTTAQAQAGTASMRMTSAGAGTLTASTGLYPVTAGATYMGFAFAANAVSTAGRTFVTQIDWYTAGSVFISSSTATIPWSMPNTGWTSPVITVAAAPPTATQAKLTALVTTGVSGAGQSVDVDTCGLGPVAAVAGNVLPYAAESCEMDVADWGAANATLARVTGALEGAFCLRATSTASGDVTITTGTRYPVTAGTEYETAAWTVPPAASRSLILEARWYDHVSAGSLLSTSTRTVSTLQASVFERHALVATAPVGATHVVMAMRPQATGASEVWYFDQMQVRSGMLTADNLLSYPAQSVEIDASDWDAAANCSVVRSAPSEPFYAGGVSLKVTCTASGQADVAADAVVPVTEGQYYNASVRFRTVGATLSIVWTDIDWYDAGMVWLGNAQPDQDSVGAGDTWRQNRIGRLAPPGAAFARLHALPQATSPGQVFYLDEFFLGPGTPPYVVDPDDDTASVTITLNSLAGFSTISLWRIDPDGTRNPVRGYGSDVIGYAITGGTMVFTDHEPPLGVPIRYEYQRNSGSITRTPPVTVNPPADTGYVWLTDPGQPARNMLVMVEKPPDWQRAQTRGVYPVRGAARPVVTADVRTSRTGTLTLLTWTADEEAALDYLLDAGTALLLRARSGWGLDYLYVAVGDVDDQRLGGVGSEAGRRWTLPLTVVGRPVGGMAGSATRTWQDVMDDPAATTWTAVRDTYPTWLDVLQGVD